MALVVVVVIGGAAQRLTAAVPATCTEPAAGSIVESKEFTPYEMRRSKLPEVPIVGEGQASATIPPWARIGREPVAGLARQFTIPGNGSIYMYFLDQPLGTMSADEFLSVGGIQLTQEAVVEDAIVPGYMFAALGDRATAVQVGGFDGALVWADPEARGNRSHNLYWSDGIYNYSVIANRTAEEVLGIGRGLVC